MKRTGINTTHPSYDKYAGRWQKCRDAVEGEYAVHEKATLYLPRLAQEDVNDYNARLRRTPFFNAVGRTVSGLKGMAFRKNPTRELPAAAERYASDIDLAGTPVDVFAQQIVQQVLEVNRVGILVDYPSVPNAGELTVAQAEALGLRPMVSMYKAETIINWREARVNGGLKLILVVLTEQADASASEFDQTTEDRWRVLDLTPDGYRQRVFRKGANGGEELLSESYPLMNGRPMTDIPFFFVAADSLKPEPETPQLMDLVEMNFHHYTVSADYEHGCHWSGLPTLFVTGYQQGVDSKAIYIGGSSANCLPDPMAKAFFVETQSNFEALRNNLEDKQAQMAVLGARMLESQKASVESAETQKTRQAGEQSQMAAVVDMVSVAMTKALSVFSQWAGGDGEVVYHINKDFIPVSMTAQELTALVSSWQAGAISEQTLFDNLKAGEIIDSSVTFEEEQERIRSQGMAGV